MELCAGDWVHSDRAFSSTGVDEYELLEWEGGAPGGGAYAAGLSSAGLEVSGGCDGRVDGWR